MMRAKAIMNPDPVKLKSTDTMQEASRKLAEKKAAMALVFDKGIFAGVLTPEEIFAEVYVKKKAGLNTPVSRFVHRNFIRIEPDYALGRIEHIYKHGPKSRFVVMGDKSPIGIITEREHVAAMRDFTQYHHLMQEAILTIFGISTAFFLFYFSPFGAVMRGG